MKVISVIVSSVVVALSPSAAWAAPFFQGLAQSHAVAVSADGSTVVGYRTGTGGAFRWTAAGGMQPLPFQSANGVSADGSTVVGWVINDPPDGDACRWTTGGSVQALGAGLLGGATAVSRDGSIVVGGGDEDAWRWTPVTGVQLLPFTSPAVSGDGKVVIGSAVYVPPDSDVVVTAYRWTASGGALPLGHLSGDRFSVANGVSDDGSAIVGYSYEGHTARSEAVRWTDAGGIQGLGFLPGASDSVAVAVSGDGSTIIGTGGEAWIWDADHGMHSLRQILEDECGLAIGGWNLGDPIAVSADGLTIIGNGTNSSGQGEAWIAVIPEPVSLPLLGLVTAAMLSRRRRNRFRCHQITLP